MRQRGRGKTPELKSPQRAHLILQHILEFEWVGFSGHQGQWTHIGHVVVAMLVNHPLLASVLVGQQKSNLIQQKSEEVASIH